MYIGDNGNVETWINQRGWGSGMVPYWTHIGITHAGQGIPGVQSLIKFGRLYGSGSLDYVYLKNETDRFEAIVYENKGSGGTRMKGKSMLGVDTPSNFSDIGVPRRRNLLLRYERHR